MSENFTWIPIYSDIAHQLVEWQDRQGELIAFLEDLRAQGLVITPLTDKDAQGDRFLFKEIDPFTFFGVFNRNIKREQRLAILDAVKQYLNVGSMLPSDFNGIPILNNMASWFIAYQSERKPNDVKYLWNVFQLALGDNPLDNSKFLQAFDDALCGRY